MAQRLAFEHSLIVFLGDSGVIFNCSGVPDAGYGVSTLRNSLGSVWSQTNVTTLHAAFADALRGPNPEVVAFSMSDIDTDEYGFLCGFAPEPDGGVRVFRKGDLGEFELVVDTIDRAVEIVLLYTDRCPAFLDLEWVAKEVVRNGVIDPSERLGLPVRALDAVETLAPGIMVTLTDNPQQPLTYGRNKEGQWEASWRVDPILRVSSTFDNLDSLLEVVQAYLGGDVTPYARTWAKANDAWKMPLWTVTAAELPDRDEMWREESVREFHQQMRLSDDEPSMMMRSFVEAANARLGKELIVSEQHLEAAPVVSIMVAEETKQAAFERLLHLARDRNISLVVNGDLVLLNSSGTAGPGRDRCPLSLWDGPLCFGYWLTTDRASLVEAAHRYQPGMDLKVESPHSIPNAERSTMSASFEDGSFTLTLRTPRMSNGVRGFSLNEAVYTLCCFPEGVESLQKEINWDGSVVLDEVPDRDRWTMGSSCYEPRPFTETIAEQLVQAGLPAVSDWVTVHDNLHSGDYCQVDRISDTEYLIEWGHELGEIECYQMKTSDFTHAVNLLREFCVEDRSDFEQLGWTLVRS